MYLLVVFLPLLSSFVVGFFGRHLGKQGSSIFSLTLLIISAFISYFLFYEVVLCHSICTIKLFTWIESDVLKVSWGFLFDSLTCTMLVLVLTVSSLVHLYSIEYMQNDPHLPRFMSYLSLFTFFMLMLVTADNYVQMFLGWEGVGLASYLLINFWHTRILANKAAMKAMIINRIGDFGIMMAMACIFYLFKSFDYAIIACCVSSFYLESFSLLGYEINIVTLIGLLLFLGAVGKSAQIGLHTWLPDAMEGPTPVSALIHAATMVTAGVFILLRSSPLLEYSEFTLFVIVIIGSLTSFMAATIGVVQYDLKKVIAYSTCSQLGYMVFACGLSNYSVSLFHLFNHGFFKALLFLSAGSVIHAMSDEQDMRKMGGLLKLLPISYVMILIGSLSLMGFPFLTGFYSKDALLELSFGTYQISGLYAFTLGVYSAFFTAFYSVRLIYMTFLADFNSDWKKVPYIHEPNACMLIPLFILAFCSIFFGYLFKELFIGLGVDTWNGALFVLPSHITLYESEFLPFYIKLIPVVFSIIGVLTSVYVYKFLNITKELLFMYIETYYIYIFFSQKWHFDTIYNYFIANNIMFFGYEISFKIIDRGFLDLIGPLGIVRLLKNLSKKTIKLQTGLIYHYIFFMFQCLFVFLLYIFIPYIFYLPLLFLFLLIIVYKKDFKENIFEWPDDENE